MDSRNFDGLLGLGFPACPFNLHEECACIYGGRGWAARPKANRGPDVFY